jgi:hypothetical protein
MIHTIYRGRTGRAPPILLLKPKGTAPLNSIKGTIEIRKVIIYFLIIFIPLKQ